MTTSASTVAPLEAIAAATGTAAAFLYRSGEFGTLEPNLQADLIVLRDNPAADIRAIRSVERVMIAGRWIDVERYRAY